MESQEKYLLVNAGSSSLKFALYKMPEKEEIVSGNIERIGEGQGQYSLKSNGEKVVIKQVIKDHDEAFKIMIEELLKNNFIKDLSDISTVVHRVVHGGEYYDNAVIVNEEVENNLKNLVDLAPLHLPIEIYCIDAAKNVLPHANPVAIFDTAFHQTIPEENYTYAVPKEWRNLGVRKYGFHGTSCKYITETLKDNGVGDNLIICHIGSGASVTCVKKGKSYDTSMGMTPLAGVVMGTRSGDVDPSIIEYISNKTNKSAEEITNKLNKESGLLGVSEVSNDFRDLSKAIEEGNKQAKLAYKVFVKSVAKYVIQYYAELQGKVDAIVFTAGIGENINQFRADVINEIKDVTGIVLDENNNNAIKRNGGTTDNGCITTSDSKIKVLILPTNEEYQMVKEAYELLSLKKKDEKNLTKINN